MGGEPNIAVGIGELLWDMLPGGKQLGGAPFNFARHCAQLGLLAYPVSRLGTDALGDETMHLLESWGVNTQYIFRDPDHSTGTVQVELDVNGRPTYQICEGVAWDHLSLSTDLMDFAPVVDVACFGSLAQRNDCSRRTILGFLDQMRTDALKVFDVNLRQHYYTIETLEQSLQRANVLKLSDEELPILSEFFSLGGSVEKQLIMLLDEFELQLIAYTRGPDGSLLMNKHEMDDHPGIPEPGIDTIGAGDSFTATLCAGLLASKPLQTINRNANQVATYVCTQNGATPDLPIEIVRRVTSRDLIST